MLKTTIDYPTKTRPIDYTNLLDLLKTYASDVENMWDQIIKEIPTGRLEGVVEKRNKIITESEAYLEFNKILEIKPTKFMEISKIVTKSWEGTVNYYKEKGISQLELLEDKLS